MLDYLGSKVAEYSILLKWLETEIVYLKTENDHPVVTGHFDEELQKLKKFHEKLRKIACINDRDSYNGNFNARAISIIRSMELKLHFITHYYLPALSRQNINDNFIREIIFKIKDSCGLFWIKDIIVILDRSYSILPYFNEIPIVYGPAQQFNTLSGLSIFHHEFGHSIFKQFQEIGNNLNKVVADHFNDVKQSSGNLTSLKRTLRDKEIDNSMNYWNSNRLNEIFCDIYSTYICGPASYYSCVDTAIKTGNVFNVKNEGPHPAWAVRVQASYNTLLDAHKKDEIVEITKKSWIEHEKLDRRDPIFDLTCSEELVNKIIKQAVLDIERFLTVERCSRTISIDGIKADLISFNIKNILNIGLKIMLSDPKCYISWEADVISQLRSSLN